MAESTPSKWSLVVGLCISSLIAIGAFWMFYSEFSVLISALTEDIDKFQYDKISLIGPRAMIAALSFAWFQVVYLFGGKLNRISQLRMIKFVLLGGALMILGRALGGFTVDHYLQNASYIECEQSFWGASRHKAEIWAKGASFCSEIP